MTASTPSKSRKREVIRKPSGTLRTPTFEGSRVLSVYKVIPGDDFDGVAVDRVCLLICGQFGGTNGSEEEGVDVMRRADGRTTRELTLEHDTLPSRVDQLHGIPGIQRLQ